MVDWNNVAETAMYYWEEFMNWFLNIPLYGQVLVVIGIAAILVLTVILVYYILKGVAYLVYYILKGTYLLLKSIGLLFYKLFEALYYAISGKPRPIKQEQEEQQDSPQVQKEPEVQHIQPVAKEFFELESNAAYCTECGAEFTERMHQQLAERSVAYCVHCGKGFKANIVEVEQY